MLLILIFNSRKNKLYSNGSFIRNYINKKKKTHGRWDTKFDTFFFFSAEWEQSFDILGQIY